MEERTKEEIGKIPKWNFVLLFIEAVMAMMFLVIGIVRVVTGDLDFIPLIAIFAMSIACINSAHTRVLGWYIKIIDAQRGE